MFKQLKNNEGNTSKENKGFSIKALTFGVVVVVIGLVCLGLGGHTAFAKTKTSSYSESYEIGYQKGFNAGYLNPGVAPITLEDKRNDYKQTKQLTQGPISADDYGTGFHDGVEAGQANRKKGNIFFTRKSWWRRFVDNIQDSWWNAKDWWKHTLAHKK